MGATYARLDKLFGIGTYTVHADFPDSGGIFAHSEVTYLGTPVGRVGSLQLRPDGVRVNLTMNSGDEKIPATAQAVVANRSAIGEQYVDLRPSSTSGPYLKEGSVITNTSIPVPVQDVISSAVDFTGSVPLNDLRTVAVVTELGKAFDNNGENLRTLVDSLSNLSKSGNDNLPQTISLIRNSDTVLTTQAAQSDEILNWSQNLELITAQLQSSDPDLRRLLTTGQTSATHLSALLERSGGRRDPALRDLALDVRNVRGTFLAASPSLALIGAVSSGSYTPSPGDGTAHFGITLETNNPPACTIGYEKTQRSSPRRSGRTRPSTSTTTTSRSTRTRSARCRRAVRPVSGCPDRGLRRPTVLRAVGRQPQEGPRQARPQPDRHPDRRTPGGDRPVTRPCPHGRLPHDIRARQTSTSPSSAGGTRASRTTPHPSPRAVRSTGGPARR